MNQQPLTPELTVAQVLEGSNTIPIVFLQHRTACVGCYLARFCTLRDVANTYELPLDEFLDDAHLTSAGNLTVASNLVQAAMAFIRQKYPGMMTGQVMCPRYSRERVGVDTNHQKKVKVT